MALWRAVEACISFISGPAATQAILSPCDGADSHDTFLNRDSNRSGEGQTSSVDDDAAYSLLSLSTQHSDEATIENDTHGVEQNNYVTLGEQSIDEVVNTKNLGDYGTQTTPKKLLTQQHTNLRLHQEGHIPKFLQWKQWINKLNVLQKLLLSRYSFLRHK